MDNLARKLYTEEEYLALEREAEFKSEYYAGEIFAMSGARAAHIQIAINISGELYIKFKKRPCKVFNSDMRVRVRPSGLYTYPDISAVCGNIEFLDETKDTLVNPNLIIEILSDSTEKYDRGQKFELYRQLPTLQEYILISTRHRKVEIYKRKPNQKWELTESVDGEPIIFESIDVQLTLDDIYDKVEF
jgi:Uma2 family endonuclease